MDGFEPTDREWEVLRHASRPAASAEFTEQVLRQALATVQGEAQIIPFARSRSVIRRFAGWTAAAALLLSAGAAVWFSQTSRPSAGHAQAAHVATPEPHPGAEGTAEAEEAVSHLFYYERLLSVEDFEALEDEDLVALLH